MEIAPLRSFLVLASEGNMTRAAETLHLTQPAVSSQLARLEAELGQMLFDRTSKGMRLTPAGEVFRDHVEEALRRLEDGREALDALGGLERGSLARKRTFRWGDLDGSPLVLFEAGTAVRGLIDHHLAKAGIRTETVMELRSIESIKQMVTQGIGAGFVSSFAVDPDHHTLACRDGKLQRDLAVIYRQGRALSPAARAFLDLMRSRRPRPGRGSSRRSRRSA